MQIDPPDFGRKPIELVLDAPSTPFAQRSGAQDRPPGLWAPLPFKLRLYQEAALNALDAYWRNGGGIH
jgi:hypothetical protein